MDFKCWVCGRTFPRYYVNKGDNYWGNRGRYNFRGAKANALRHVRACEKRKHREEEAINALVEES